MKKLITMCMAAFALQTNAAMVMVEVEDFEFNPAVFTVNVGDTIMWFWDSGSHTTTSTTIPAGAASWSQAINQNSPAYTYVVTVAGSYDFVCLPHQSMGMMGHFTANVTTGIEELAAGLQLSQHIKDGQLTISYALPETGSAKVNIYNLIGTPLHTVDANNRSAGTYNEVLDLTNFPDGIYITELVYGNIRKSLKFMLD
jgi:plastocyanin